MRALGLKEGTWKSVMIAPFVVLFVIWLFFIILLSASGGSCVLVIFPLIPYALVFVNLLFVLLHVDDTAKDGSKSIPLKIFTIFVGLVSLFLLCKLKGRTLFEVRRNNQNRSQTGHIESTNTTSKPKVYKFKPTLLRYKQLSDIYFSNQPSAQNPRSATAFNKMQKMETFSEDMCQICMEKSPNVIMLDCKHGGICNACAENYFLERRER